MPTSRFCQTLASQKTIPLSWSSSFAQGRHTTNYCRSKLRAALATTYAHRQNLAARRREGTRVAGQRRRALAHTRHRDW